MRLTVGPLPPAVYWRRRAAILGILLLLVLLVSYSCSNASGAARKKRVFTPTTGSPPAATASATQSAYTPPSGLPSQGQDPPADSGSDQSNTSAGGSTTDTSSTQTGPCTDGEITLTVAPEPASVARAAFVKFTLSIKNTSTRSCTRDVGADPQELYLQDDAKSKIWSSDTCEPAHGSDVRTFKPGDVAEFYVVWNGKATNAGCTNQQPPPAGKYQLVGRLSTKLSDPSPLDIK